MTDENDGAGPGTLEPFVLFHLITDFDTPAGRELAQNAFETLVSNILPNGTPALTDFLLVNPQMTDPTLRLSFVHNPGTESQPSPFSLSSLLYYLMHTEPASLLEVLPVEFLHFLRASIEDLEAGVPLGMGEANPIIPFLAKGLSGEGELAKAQEFWADVRPLATKFGIHAGENAIVMNGRVRLIGQLVLLMSQSLIELLNRLSVLSKLESFPWSTSKLLLRTNLRSGCSLQ